MIGATEMSRAIDVLTGAKNWARSNPVVRDRSLYATGAIVRPSRLPRTLLILTSGRAGSDLLVSLLNTHPNVVCEGELLQVPSRLPRWKPRVLLKGAAVQGMRAARRRGEPSKVFGWKVGSNDLRWHPSRYPDPAGFIRESIGEHGVLVVVRRRNFVAQALSWQHAEATRYHFTEALDFKKLQVDPEAILAQSFTYEDEDRWIADVTKDLPKLEFFYEDDLFDSESQQRSVDRIVRALDLDPFQVETPLKRITPRSPSERIANIEEVRQVFAPTRYRALLEGNESAGGSSEPP